MDAHAGGEQQAVGGVALGVLLARPRDVGDQLDVIDDPHLRADREAGLAIALAAAVIAAAGDGPRADGGLGVELVGARGVEAAGRDRARLDVPLAGPPLVEGAGAHLDRDADGAGLDGGQLRGEHAGHAVVLGDQEQRQQVAADLDAIVRAVGDAGQAHVTRDRQCARGLGERGRADEQLTRPGVGRRGVDSRGRLGAGGVGEGSGDQASDGSKKASAHHEDELQARRRASWSIHFASSMMQVLDDTAATPRQDLPAR